MRVSVPMMVCTAKIGPYIETRCICKSPSIARPGDGGCVAARACMYGWCQASNVGRVTAGGHAPVTEPDTVEQLLSARAIFRAPYEIHHRQNVFTLRHHGEWFGSAGRWTEPRYNVSRVWKKYASDKRSLGSVNIGGQLRFHTVLQLLLYHVCL